MPPPPVPLQAKLQSLDVKAVYPKLCMDPTTLQSYLANPPEGLAQLVWEQAKQDNPDPTKYVGVHCTGATVQCVCVWCALARCLLLLCRHGQPFPSFQANGAAGGLTAFYAWACGWLQLAFFQVQLSLLLDSQLYGHSIQLSSHTYVVFHNFSTVQVCMCTQCASAGNC